MNVPRLKTMSCFVPVPVPDVPDVFLFVQMLFYCTSVSMFDLLCSTCVADVIIFKFYHLIMLLLSIKDKIMLLRFSGHLLIGGIGTLYMYMRTPCLC